MMAEGSRERVSFERHQSQKNDTPVPDTLAVSVILSLTVPVDTELAILWVTSTPKHAISEAVDDIS